MSPNRIPGYRKVLREGRMISIVDETAMFAERLQAMEHRGLGDTREAARQRVADKTGVPESYLKRLRYEARVMRDVAGSHYRALRAAYEREVEKEERLASAMAATREAVEHGLAIDEKQAATMVAGLAAWPRYPAVQAEEPR